MCHVDVGVVHDRVDTVSRAAQLERWLEPDIQPLGPMDDAAFGQITRHEFVRFEGVLHVPEIIRTAFTAAAFGKLASVAQAFGADLGDFDGTMSQIDGLMKLVEHDGFPITADERHGGAAIMFIARPELILGEPLSLDGEEVLVLGRVKSLVTRGTTLSQSELLPNLSHHLPNQNRQQRRSSGSDLKPVSLKGPALLIDPIAVYS